MSPTVLSARGLSKQFGGITAVADMSIDISSDDIVGLVGPNGAGKTTVFNLLSGLVRADTGHVTLDDQDITNRPAWQLARLGIQRTYQTIRLFRSLSVLDNVAMGALRTRGTPLGLREARHIANDVLDRLGFSAQRARPPSELPYAFQRVVEIARALASRPKVLLLDEPAAGMHQTERDALCILIRNLHEDGLAIALVEHDVGLVSKTCDTVTVMDFGRVIARGAPADIRANPAVVEAFIGSATVSESDLT